MEARPRYAAAGGTLRHLFAMLFLTMCLAPGCVYKMGGNLTAGILDEASGEGKTGGLNGATRSLLEEQLVRELGKQLGDGVVAGAVTEDQQQRLETMVDALISVAAARAGTGLRDDVGPELRAMIRRDLTQALADGVREDLSGSLEEVVEKLIRKAMLTVEDQLRDPAMTVALADMLRDTLYLALREGRPGTPGIGDSLRKTLDVDVLSPVETSVGGIAAELAERVDESAQRTENVLKSVIGGLLVLLAGGGILYMVNQQQLNRHRESTRLAEQEASAFHKALGQLDAETRERVLAARGGPVESPPPEARSQDYER